VWSVHVGCIEQRDAEVERAVDRRDRGGVVTLLRIYKNLSGVDSKVARSFWDVGGAFGAGRAQKIPRAPKTPLRELTRAYESYEMFRRFE